ncbi:MAG: TIGR03067 domain-containing protein [Planctomycetia bacterium]|nr:TIGR03067 domain-containing protein [Planctomycetia bacterium]
MKTFFHAGLALCAVLISVLAHARAADTDQEKLQGKWTVESFEYNATPIEMMKNATREFKDGKYTLTPKVGDAIEGTIKIDQSKKPKTIDLDVNGRILKGIYELEGDTLRMCYLLTDGERPTEFATKPDTGLILISHKRAK